MKSKQQNPPKSNGRSGAPPSGAGVDPNAGDPEDLQAMWSAVAALLDDTTVGAPPVSSAPVNKSPVNSSSSYGAPVTNAPAQPVPAAPASSAPAPIPPSAQIAPVDWAPTSTQNTSGQNASANGGATAPASQPAAPAPLQKSRWNPLFGSRSSQPPAPAQPPVTAPPSEQPNFGQPQPYEPTADAPTTDAPITESPVAPRATNGNALVPPYAPGAGPQILPAPDGYLDTPAAPVEMPLPQQPTLPRLPGEPFILPEGLDTQSVMIRGRNDGVGIQVGDGAWRDLLYMLSYRIEQTDGFFRGNHIAVDVGGRHLNEADLNQMRFVMRSYGLDPSLLRTSSERTFMAALALGIPVSQIGGDGSPVNEAIPAESEGEGLGFFVYRGSLRSGQVLYRREHIIVIGDINPGAEVVSDGDIMVWGRLRGIAHAGARGNTNSVITALDLDPVQLRIDQVIGAAQAGISSNGPRWGASRSAERKAELARLVDGKLTIMQWDEAKSGGVALLKRKFF